MEITFPSKASQSCSIDKVDLFFKLKKVLVLNSDLVKYTQYHLYLSIQYR